jgi:hypothetical protein
VLDKLLKGFEDKAAQVRPCTRPYAVLAHFKPAGAAVSL